MHYRWGWLLFLPSHNKLFLSKAQKVIRWEYQRTERLDGYPNQQRTTYQSGGE